MESSFHSYVGKSFPTSVVCTWIPNSTEVWLDFAEQIDSSYGIDEEGIISEESHMNVPESSIIIPTRGL